MTIRVLRTSILAVLGFGILGSAAMAAGADGIARVSHSMSHPQYQQPAAGPYYAANAWGRRPHRQQPNPTYWTWMPLPFHGCCDYCADANCPGKKGFWTFPAVRWALDPDYYTVSPDYGWSPPAKVPVRRSNVTYSSYGPANSGAKRQVATRRPIIATPTDTLHVRRDNQTKAQLDKRVWRQQAPHLRASTGNVLPRKADHVGRRPSTTFTYQEFLSNDS